VFVTSCRPLDQEYNGKKTFLILTDATTTDKQQ